MIRNSLQRTKESTFIVHVPDIDDGGNFIPVPNGTGFFISPDGYFITARHVIEGADVIWLNQPMGTGPMTIMGPSEVKLVKEWNDFDIALFKVDYFILRTQDNRVYKNKHFPYLEIDFKEQEEGTPVYSYGFPMPYVDMDFDGGHKFGFHYYHPRTTSAIISSLHEVIGPDFLSFKSKNYVIDKALNYGNSGGPIVLTETGKVISVYTEFQTVEIPQDSDAPTIRGLPKKRNRVQVEVPSLYGISSSLCNIKDDLDDIMNTNKS